MRALFYLSKKLLNVVSDKSLDPLIVGATNSKLGYWVVTPSSSDCNFQAHYVAVIAMVLP